MKCKILTSSTRIELEQLVQKFLNQNYEIIHISYSSYKDGYTPNYSVMIIYK